MFRACCPDLARACGTSHADELGRAISLQGGARGVNLVQPGTQALAQRGHLSGGEHARSDPGDLHRAAHLVDGATHEAQRQSLHEQELDAAGVEARALGNRRQRQRARVGREAEGQRQQRHDSHLLAQSALVRHQCGLRVHLWAVLHAQRVVLRRVAIVEGAQQRNQPRVLSGLHGLDDGMLQQLAKRVHVLAQQCRQTEVHAQRAYLRRRHLHLEVDKAEVHERRTIKVGELALRLGQLRRHPVHRG
mmetsp:Transcript_2661/g.7966  ORF Transcript_2661/g.7966 Transcript_2661/m.7966 type:complete len:248 (-) Transcript_2661:687-1430(-)